MALAYCIMCFHHGSVPMGHHYVCLPCHKELSALILRAPERSDLLIDDVSLTSLYGYRGSLRNLIHRAKIASDQAALRFLVQLFATNDQVIALAIWSDVIMPAPSSLWGRLRGRLDLAFHFAMGISGRVGRPLLHAPAHLHWRLRKHALRGRLNRQAGQSPWPPSWTDWALKRWRRSWKNLAGEGQKILLVDDVVTTGQTLKQVSDFLPGGDTLEIRYLTLARA